MTGPNMGHLRPAINRNPPGASVAGFVVFGTKTGDTRVTKTLAGKPAKSVMPASDLDMFPDACANCADPGPTILTVLTGKGETVTGHLCMDCLNKLVSGATNTGEVMVTGRAGGIFRQLVTPLADGALPDPTGSVTDQIETFIAELAAMVETDPARNTENEVSFLGGNRERTRQIGAALNAIGGGGLMFGVHAIIGQRFSNASARHLEIAWNGVGQWRA